LNSDQSNSGLTGSVPAGIFKAYDIRGIVGSELTTDLVFQIGQAIGSEAHERNQDTVVVARDGRLSGEEMVDALTSGLCASGRNVIDIGMVPTPVLYFATHHFGTGSGVMVTASHNPPDHNGFKIMLAGETLAEETITNLRLRIETMTMVHDVGDVTVRDVVPEYITAVMNNIHLERPFKVVIDCGNGVTGQFAPRLIRQLGCEVTELFCDVDGRFPNHSPDPSQIKNLATLIKTVRDSRADIGLAFDGDGDRLAVVDGNGKVIWPDRQLMLFAQEVLPSSPGATVIYDVKCSRYLPIKIRACGGVPLIWKSGHSLIKRKMSEINAVLAGEFTGHMFFRDRWYGFDDGIYAAARLLEILSKDERTPAQVFDNLPESVVTPELYVEMSHQDGVRFLKRLEKELLFPSAKTTYIDGIRIDFNDGWGLVRVSNTMPVLVFRFEAEDKKGLLRIQEFFSKAVHAVDDRIELPF
jgi:phosphomannomutase/phosphoglucomutase